ncbi:uncharacterized protein VTP21DRAFT_3020 [Calcarisporiella thermophila]|uniref:uncharacterized protein n=1 Tax=Calcarisporiella thermophila TaxID=911321 RepID=UPI0037433B38
MTTEVVEVLNEKPQDYATERKASAKSEDSTVVSEDIVLENGKQLKVSHAPKRNASSWTAFVNVVCAVAGAGALGIPHAVQQCGWCGIILLALAHIMAGYSGVVLIKCLYYKGNEYRLSSYQEVGEHAFGKIGKYLTIVFNCTIQLGAPILYLILSGTNFQLLLGPLGVPVSMKAWVFILTGTIAVPFVLTKTMKEVAILSLFGVLATAVTVVVVMIVSSVEYGLQTEHAEHAFLIPARLPIALSTFAFAYGGNVIYPHVEGTMAKPKQWTCTFNLGLMLVSVLYFGVAIPSYLAYGNATANPVYNNLPAAWPRTVAIIFITAHVLLATPLFLTSFALEVEGGLNINRVRYSARKELLLRATVRILTILLCATIAVVIPYFENVMELMGSVAQGAIVFIFPLLFYVKLYGWRSFRWYELLWIAIAVAIGTAGSVIGMIDAVHGLIAAIKADSHSGLV